MVVNGLLGSKAFRVLYSDILEIFLRPSSMTEFDPSSVLERLKDDLATDDQYNDP